MPENKDYEPDFEIANKYIDFSSELLKISLTAISGIGALIIFDEKNYTNETIDKWLFAAICMFSLSIGASLFHRFYATDFMSWHINYLRTKDPSEKKGRERCLKFAEKSLIAAEYLFALAIIVMGVGIYQVLNKN